MHLEVGISHFSMRVILQRLLASAIPKELEGIPKNIGMRAFQNISGMGYRCAIAFELARIQKLSSMAIASRVTSALPNTIPAKGNRLLLDFTVEVVDPGWIDFYLGDRALANWLQNLPYLWEHDCEPQQQRQENFFALQYAHARCCSLLRSGQERGLIRLRSSQLDRSIWQWAEPDPIPWLASRPTPGRFLLVHPAERHLIFQILEIADLCSSAKKKDWARLAERLSDAVLEFDRACRILIESPSAPDLQRARLGAVAIAQFLLGWLLRDRMGVFAPLEL